MPNLQLSNWIAMTLSNRKFSLLKITRHFFHNNSKNQWKLVHRYMRTVSHHNFLWMKTFISAELLLLLCKICVMTGQTKKLTWKKKRKSLIFSSPELFLSPVVRLSVNCFYFQILLKNHWANYNQTWHKASLGNNRGFKFVQMKGHPLHHGEIIAK